MKLISARVAHSNPLAEDLWEVALEVDQELLASCAPGQCAHVQVPGDDARLLRRPISVYSTQGGLLRLAIQPKGEGTKRIIAAKSGDELSLIFPFGKGFHADGAKDIALVGGGLGVAPIRGCAEGFAGARLRAYFGFRTQAHVYAVKECEAAGCDVTVCTDDGSAGLHGLVTVPLQEALEKDKPDLIMACGPTPMLRAVQALAKEYQVPCQLSLEQRMGCGVGACLVCACAASWGGYMRVCADGPVFSSEEVQL